MSQIEQVRRGGDQASVGNGLNVIMTTNLRYRAAARCQARLVVQRAVHAVPIMRSGHSCAVLDFPPSRCVLLTLCHGRLLSLLATLAADSADQTHARPARNSGLIFRLAMIARTRLVVTLQRAASCLVVNINDTIPISAHLSSGLRIIHKKSQITDKPANPADSRTILA